MMAYKDAGVDIAAGNALVDRIKPLAASTRRPGVMDGLGGFGAMFDLQACGYRDPVLVSGTDGVGTKLKLAQQLQRHETVGIDLVAMCANDLVVQGAEPLFFLDYFATGALEVAVGEQVVKGIAEGCRLAGCALIGGETAEMPGMYGEGEYDLAGFCVGAVERDAILPNTEAMQPGDILLGLASSGVHSNGYSLVRHVMDKNRLAYDTPSPFAKGQTFGDAFLTPTRLYVRACLKAIATGGVRGLAHITGGGLTENLPRVLPPSLAARIDTQAWERPAVFAWLQEAGVIDDAEMWQTFNCGIGMALVCAPEQAGAVQAVLEQAGETVWTIGMLEARTDAAVTFTV